MSKFSSISSDFQNQIKTALSELSSYSFDTVSSNFNNYSVLSSTANSVITDALDDLQNNEYKASYAKLKKTLDSAEEIYNKIVEIKKLDDEIKTLKNQLPGLESQKYKTETYSYPDYFGNICTGTNTVLDQSVVSQINNVNSKITNKENQIKNLENQINNII